MRLSDLVKGSGQGRAPAREPADPSQRMSALVREEGMPAAPDQDSIPSSDQSGEGSKGDSSQASGGVAAVEQERPTGPSLTDAAVAAEVLQRAIQSIEAILQAIRSRTTFTLTHAEEAVAAVYQDLQASDALLILIFSGGGHYTGSGQEAANVCVLALKIGMELGYPAEELRKLGLAALLADAGMARLPEELLTRNGPLSAAERASLHQFPEQGARLLGELGLPYRWLAEVLLQVHERLDGSGYPKGLKGKEIMEFAQIVGLADVYESLVHHRPFRRSLGPVDALREILHRERAAFSDRILKALIRALTAFPVGSLVRLNTGEIGRVVAKNRDFPLRPAVEVLLRQGKPLEDPLIIDLSKNPLLHVQESVVEEGFEQEATRERA